MTQLSVPPITFPLLPAPREQRFSAQRVTGREPSVWIGADMPWLQGYALTVHENGTVAINAADAAGAFYAKQTLTQLERLCDGQLPVGQVRDWPDLRIRGVMLDISRDKVPTFETLLAIVDRLAEWKVNHLELYAEHTFAYPGHEVVWHEAGAMTAEEIEQLDDYCAARHIELVPNQNCLGHMARWLKHPPYTGLAMAPEGYVMLGLQRPPSTIEPTNPASLALVRGLLGELVPHFHHTRFVNVGLDEPWEMPADRIDDYLEWVRTLRALPEIDGLELLVWGDILAGEPERIRALPDGVTVCEWGYDAGHPFEARARVYEQCGRPFWTAPGTSSWLTILGRITNVRANCAEAVDAAVAHGGAGMLNTDWGDQGHLQYLPISEPGLAYGAAVAWCAQANRDLDLGTVLSAHCYGDRTGELAAALLALGDAYLALTPQIGNVASLVLHLYWPQLRIGRPPLEGVTADEYTAVEAVLAQAFAALERARPSRADGALVLDELRNAIELVAILCSDARARLRGDGALASIPAAERELLADRLRPVIKEHERLWLARNRPGGLRESRAWLEHLLQCYETGTTDRTWGGPE